MNKKEKHIARRILLATAIGFLSVIAFLILGSVIARFAPDQQVFFSLKLIVGVVAVAIIIGDRVYVSKQNQ